MAERAETPGCGERTAARTLISLLKWELSKPDYRRERIAISFSGGLDSTLIAALAKMGAEVVAIVVGTRDSVDIKNARTSAPLIGLDIRELLIDEAAVLGAASELCRITGSADPLMISFELPTYIALKSAEERIMITGQGADELFGGYARYRDMSPQDFASRRVVDVDNVLGPISCIEDAISASQHKAIMKPYLSNEIVSFAMSLPIDMVRPGILSKVVIREALKELGLEEIAMREKKAAQYGSGVSAMLKRAAKRNGMTMRGFMADIAKRGS